MNTDQDAQRHTKSFLKTKMMAAAFLLLVLAVGFNALLTSASLKKLYIESLAAGYQVVAKDLQQKVQTALSYGKSLHKFLGIDQILETALDSTRLQDEGSEPVRDRRYTALALKDGTVLYASDPAQVGRRLPIAALLDPSETDAPLVEPYVEDGDRYIVALPVSERGGAVAAAAVIAFDQSQVQALLNASLAESLRIGMSVIGIGLLLLWVANILILPRERSFVLGSLRLKASPPTRKFPRRMLSAALLVVIILCQGTFSYFGASSFGSYYLEINREKVVTLNMLLRSDIEFFLEKGLPLDRLHRMDVMMGNILKALPEVHDISIVDADDRLLYQADHQQAVSFQNQAAAPPVPIAQVVAEGPYNVKVALRNEGREVGRLFTNISRAAIDAKIRQIIIDALTVLVISLLFSVELLIMIFQFLDKASRTEGVQTVREYGKIRPAAFIFLFGIDISISFLPLHMGKLYEPLFGLSRDVVLGLPISVEMFFVMISLYAAGAWIDRRGWREPFLWGLALAGCGVAYSWLAPNALHFIMSRAVVGLGYGFSLMAAQGFVISNSTDQTQAQGLSALFAGVYSGSICGGAAGGMLAERIGYHPVFFIGAMIVFLVIAYTLILIRVPSAPSLVATPPPIPEEAPAPSGRQVLRFLFNRDVFSLILLSSLPSAIAVVGFINYFSPIYLNRIGASQSNIGRVYMIYGICLILIAPYLSRFIDASSSKKRFIVIAGLLGGMGFVGFSVLSGYIAVASAVFLLGLSDSFEQSRNAYALKLKITNELGAGKAFGIFNAASRIGQVIGPFLFGWMLLAVGGGQMIVWFGVFYLAITFFFLVVARSDRRTV